MNRRAKRPNDFDILANHNVYAAPEQVDTEIFGEMSQTPVVRMVNIFDIEPDPTQPRRAIPSAVTYYLNKADLFNGWVGHAENENNTDIHVKALLHSNEDVQRNEHPGPIEASLLTVIDLAASILRDGLTNPITVVELKDQKYRLETGERRWLAYHLLYLMQEETDEQKKKWKTIPAQIFEETNVWRQASENTARQDLNAIGRARQFAILLMDLLEKDGQSFTPFSEMIKRGQSDRSYYAQVADGEQFRIPRGRSEVLVNAMGLSHEKQLRQYRALLRLPEEVWHLADDLNWAEGKLRALASLPEAEAIELAYQIMAEDADTGTIVAVSEQQPISQATRQRPSHGNPGIEEPRYYSELRKNMLKANNGNQDALARAREMIETLTQWLENMEDQEGRRR